MEPNKDYFAGIITEKTKLHKIITPSFLNDDFN